MARDGWHLMLIIGVYNVLGTVVSLPQLVCLLPLMRNVGCVLYGWHLGETKC